MSAAASRLLQIFVQRIGTPSSPGFGSSQPSRARYDSPRGFRCLSPNLYRVDSGLTAPRPVCSNKRDQTQPMREHLHKVCVGPADFTNAVCAETEGEGLPLSSTQSSSLCCRTIDPGPPGIVLEPFYCSSLLPYSLTSSAFSEAKPIDCPLFRSSCCSPCETEVAARN